MTARTRFTIALATAVMLPILLVSAVTAAPPSTPPGLSEHQRIIDYWTPARVARAVPRQIVIDAPLGPDPRAGNSKGGGKPGGGGSTALTGSPWTGAGLVKATTGKVLFTLAGTDYVCSGSVVADSRLTESMVLTAGHCVYDDVSDSFATNWLFVPDYEDGATFNCALTRYGCWTAQSLVTTAAWAGSDFNHDYAFAVMGAGGLDGATLLEDAVGTMGIAFNLVHPRSVYAFGYPHAAPYGGSQLIYCAGTGVADGWGGSTDFGLDCDMTGGSSGGPWFADFDPASGAGQLNSVNSFKYRAGPYKKYMFGPYFGSYAQLTYTAAQAAPDHQLVTAP